jgi:hypothetical protein
MACLIRGGAVTAVDLLLTVLVLGVIVITAPATRGRRCRPI